MPSPVPPEGAEPAPADRLAQVRARIAAAARQAGRDGADVALTAVSKQQPWEAIAPVLAAGQRVFGENRVQEAGARWAPLRAAGEPVELRLIGPLQTNKAADAVALFDAIETLDRPRLARTLADAVQAQGRAPRLLVQVNTGEEPQKAGIAPDALAGFLHELGPGGFGLPVEGLMCIPPAEEPAAPHFCLLADLAARHGLAELSMGMSGDYELAVRCGATRVRVGSALFGERERAG